MVNIAKILFIVILIWCCVLVAGVPKSKVVRCAVCRSLVSELHHEMDKVDPRHKIEVGSYRIGSDGSQMTTSRSYAGSETHMTDVMEAVCESFKDYAQAKHKETGRVEVIAIVGKDGQMNPSFSEYELIPDPDLNKGLEYHCQSIVEDFEDDIFSHFSKLKDRDMKKSQDVFCNDVTKVCKDIKEEL